LLFFSSIAGLVCSVVVCMRLFRLATPPRLYRRSLYVFITGNAALVLNGWWAEALEDHLDIDLVFGVPLFIMAAISFFGPFLARRSGVAR